MDQWLEHSKPYKPDYPNILIGPMKEDQYKYLKTVTFYSSDLLHCDALKR
jgi:hypothetical protein